MSGTVEKRAAIGGPARLPQLDGLRGLAACGVAFLYHPQSLFSPASFAGAPGIFIWFQTWGWTLVDLFFVISGYIFAHVYLQGQGALTRNRIGSFAVARIARLYPLHLLMLGICAMLFWDSPSNSALALGAHLLMLQAFVQPLGHTFNGPSWSISVEMVCYLLFALGATSGRRALLWVTLLAIVGAMLHFALAGRPSGPWVGDSLPRGLLGFFIGQVLWRMRVWLAKVPSLLLACILVVALMLDMGRASSLWPLCLGAWPALLLLALRMPWAGSAPMRWLGDRSYAVYLVHYPMLIAVQCWWAPFGGGMATVWGVTVTFALSVLIISDLCHRCIEIPARQAIRAAWNWHRSSAGTGSTSLA